MRSRWPASAALCAIFLLFASCGGTSLNPTPTVSALFPSTVAATLIGTPACNSNPSFTINVQGNNFLTNSVAYWNGSMRKSTFNDATGQLTMTVLACDIASPGVAYVSVTNPPPGGGPSPSAVTFQISQPANPSPSISSLSPASTAAGSLPPGGILTINGAPAASGSNSPAFISSSQASINGNARTTTFVSATELQVQMLASDVANAGTLTVSVSNPSPGGGVSSAPFTVTDPPNGMNLPQVVSISATGGAANGRSSSPAMSATGRYVAFYSEATNLVTSGASGNIFVRDTCTGADVNCTPHTIAVDLAPDGSAPNAAADSKVSISADGRYIAFSSSATNLSDPSPEAPNPDDLRSNVFVRDLCIGATSGSACSPHTTQVSLGVNGESPDGESDSPSLSADGRFIAFESQATNLVAGLEPSFGQVYVRDLCVGAAVESCRPTTNLASTGNTPAETFWAMAPSISANGRYVAFAGVPAELVNQQGSRIYLRDTCQGEETLRTCAPSLTTISFPADGLAAAWTADDPSVSSDGRFVVFEELETPQPAQVGVVFPEVLLRDTCLGKSAPRACAPSSSVLPLDRPSSDGASGGFGPLISPSGRYVSFAARVGALSSPTEHVFVRDTCAAARDTSCVAQTSLDSVASSGETGNRASYPRIVMSADGHLIAFGSDATNLASPTSGLGDVFLMQMPTLQH